MKTIRKIGIMNTIYKTGFKNTYFGGNVSLRDNSKTNWADPIGFPTVFVAHGAAIKSGNWQSCTSINTPAYVIERYFNNREGSLKPFWSAIKKLKKITWSEVENDKENVLSLINLANNELLKLKTL